MVSDTEIGEAGEREALIMGIRLQNINAAGSVIFRYRQGLGNGRMVCWFCFGFRNDLILQTNVEVSLNFI